jgi:uncharacterized protein YchJ
MTAPTPNYLQKVLESSSHLERGRVYFASVFHDDWCASNLTTNCQDCNCKPIVRVNSTPFEREEPKIGRNELCPCASGRKYKKCCSTE